MENGYYIFKIRWVSTGATALGPKQTLEALRLDIASKNNQNKHELKTLGHELQYDLIGLIEDGLYFDTLAFREVKVNYINQVSIPNKVINNSD